jgi:hypothetical protein
VGEEFVGAVGQSGGRPIVVATDIMGHFYTTVLWEGEIYILDSLDPYMESKFDSPIVECMANLYREGLGKGKPQTE